MWSQNFMLSAEAFHAEVNSLSGVTGEIREGRYINFFNVMVPPLLPGEKVSDSRKCMTKQELQPIIKKLKNQMSSLKESIPNIGISTGSVSKFPQSQSLIHQNPLCWQWSLIILFVHRYRHVGPQFVVERKCCPSFNHCQGDRGG